MKRLTVRLTVVVAALAVCAIALTLWVLPQLVAERAAVPFQYMWVSFEDEDGAATIRSDAFRVAFAAHSFGSHSSGGNYLVDGRYGFRLFAGPDSAAGQAADGVAYNYSQRRRLLTFQYQGHELTYSDALQKLTLDGREYSTAAGQVDLLVKGNGAVEPAGK